ncbi:NUDIX hydrolase [Actinocorallia populi]|uniref:NUDIX hydrolase n=1 Tax=Actinocorallia populi TaxID=2079200 RepID=UPI001E6070B5|nr:CoA pyrophosphatase [Actinocorallia populi]
MRERRQQIAQRLTESGHVEIGDSPGMRRASVVVCVTEQDGEPCVLLIRRAMRGRNPGQWALPGGRREPGETVEQTALRELHEELGVALAPADVLGRLDDFPAFSGFVISPVVAVPESLGPLAPNPDEVGSVHHIPLARLAADDVVHFLDTPQGPLLQMRLGPGTTIHAPTGAILLQFRESVLLGNPLRVADLLQPDWTIS